MTEQGGLSDAYRKFAKAVPNLSAAELKRRHETARRIIQEQRITYNVSRRSARMERPWQLDPLPLLWAQPEWRKLETALIQRATLLNLHPGGLLRRPGVDSGGPARRPALVFGQPDFLRPCHGLRPPGGIFLHLYAADLVRSSDGQWWVVSDRTQIPAGAGYALANRLITARVLPEPFRDCNAQTAGRLFPRPAGHAGQPRAPGARTIPRIVLLTPGPFNETYFEQAWLARYLGYSLVEGQDLTVRDDRLCSKPSPAWNRWT